MAVVLDVRNTTTNFDLKIPTQRSDTYLVITNSESGLSFVVHHGEKGAFAVKRETISGLPQQIQQEFFRNCYAIIKDSGHVQILGRVQGGMQAGSDHKGPEICTTTKTTGSASVSYEPPAKVTATVTFPTTTREDCKDPNCGTSSSNPKNQNVDSSWCIIV